MHHSWNNNSLLQARCSASIAGQLLGMAAHDQPGALVLWAGLKVAWVCRASPNPSAPHSPQLDASANMLINSSCDQVNFN